jgi:hypothetical protein
MCGFVLRTPGPDDKAEVPALILDLSIITHRLGRGVSGPGTYEVGYVGAKRQKR